MTQLQLRTDRVRSSITATTPICTGPSVLPLSVSIHVRSLFSCCSLPSTGQCRLYKPCIPFSREHAPCQVPLSLNFVPIFILCIVVSTSVPLSSENRRLFGNWPQRALTTPGEYARYVSLIQSLSGQNPLYTACRWLLKEL